MNTRRWLAVGSVLVVAATSLVATAGVAQAEQHKNANAAAYWSQPDNITSEVYQIEQRMVLERGAPKSYWALQWSWADDPLAVGGYLGVQRNGYRFDGKRGDVALFSLWNAEAVDGPSCGSFAFEGTGLSCRVPLYFLREGEENHFYLSRDTADMTGLWWKASINSYELGRIKVDKRHRAVTNLVNFSEYWGDAVACNAVPHSRAHWNPPVGFGTGFAFDYAYQRFRLGSCAEAGVGQSQAPYSGRTTISLGTDTGWTTLNHSWAGLTPEQEASIAILACKTLNSTIYGPVWHVKYLFGTSIPDRMEVGFSTQRTSFPNGQWTFTTLDSNSTRSWWLGSLALLETNAYALPTGTDANGYQYWDFVQPWWWDHASSNTYPLDGGNAIAAPGVAFNYDSWKAISTCR